MNLTSGLDTPIIDKRGCGGPQKALKSIFWGENCIFLFGCQKLLFVKMGISRSLKVAQVSKWTFVQIIVWSFQQTHLMPKIKCLALKTKILGPIMCQFKKYYYYYKNNFLIKREPAPKYTKTGITFSFLKLAFSFLARIKFV